MAEGAASIIGILAATASVARSLTGLVGELRNAPEDVMDLRQELQNLSALVQSAHDVTVKHPLRSEEAPLAETVTGCLDRCQAVMLDIREQLKHFLSSSGSGMRSPMRLLSWTMRRAEIRSLRDKLRDSKASLQLSIMVLTA
jgi:hypothetical protein